MNARDLHYTEIALQSIEAAAQYAGPDEDAFLRDPMKRDACLMRLLVAGEYANKISDRVQSAHPSPIWQQAKRARNYYAHAYGGVNWRHVFETVQSELPDLRTLLLQVQSGLEKEETDHATDE